MFWSAFEVLKARNESSMDFEDGNKGAWWSKNASIGHSKTSEAIF